MSQQSKTFGKVRPDAVAMAGRRAEIARLEHCIAALGEEQQRARRHLETLARENQAESETLQVDRARLAALDLLAQAAGGALPEAAEEEERRKLRRRLVDRPTSLAAALAADVERVDREVAAMRHSVETERTQLAAEQALEAEFAEEDMARDVEAVRHGTASPAQQSRVSNAGRWPAR